MKKIFRFSEVDKQFAILMFTIIVYLATMLVSKSYELLQYNSFIFFWIYVIIGCVVPVFINIKNMTKIRNLSDKNFFRFSMYFAIGFSLILENVIFTIRQDEFYYIVKNSLINSFSINELVGLSSVLAFCFILTIYFNCILNAFKKEYAWLYGVTVCTIVYTIIFSDDVLKSAILSFVAFSLMTIFSKIKIGYILISVSSITSYIFANIYLKYHAFGIMHHINFILMIIGFICIIRSVKIMEKIMLYYKFEKMRFISLKQKEVKIIWFIMLLFGIFIATFNGRF